MTKAKDLAHQIVQAYYPDADAAFLCGSNARGEARPGSDIDLVVVWQERDAKRENFLYNDTLVEAFLHDPHSLNVFYGKDRDRARPVLAHMISDSVDLNPSIFSFDLREQAQRQVAKGPYEWTQAEIERSRFEITDLTDNIKDAEDHVEIYALAAPLFQALFTHHQRIRNQWDARGTHLVKALHEDKTGWGRQFINAFDSLYKDGDVDLVVKLVDDELKSVGGRIYTWSLEADIYG